MIHCRCQTGTSSLSKENLPLVRTGIQLDVGTREVSRNTVTRQQNSSRLVLSKWLRKFEKEGLQDDSAGHASIAIEVCLGKICPCSSIIGTLVNEEVLTIRSIVGSSSQNSRLALLTVLIEHNRTSVASSLVWPVGWWDEDGGVLDKLGRN
jgi:hypothetical protein